MCQFTNVTETSRDSTTERWTEWISGYIQTRQYYPDGVKPTQKHPSMHDLSRSIIEIKEHFVNGLFHDSGDDIDSWAIVEFFDPQGDSFDREQYEVMRAFSFKNGVLQRVAYEFYNEMVILEHNPIEGLAQTVPPATCKDMYVFSKESRTEKVQYFDKEGNVVD